MTPLLECLSRWPQQPLGTVVHVGAGDGAVLDDYAELQPQRLVLVEGDAQALTELQAGAQGRPGVEVLGVVVAPLAGTVPWHRFSLRMLNGPVAPAGLEAYYPRLRSVGVLPVAAVALSELLVQTLASEPAPAPRLLVLDVPGQEAELLASLPDALLQRFDGVVLRGCSAGLRPDGLADTDAAVAALGERLFVAIDSALDAEPLWPVYALAFDAVAHRQRQLEDRLAAIGRERDTARSQLAELELRLAGRTDEARQAEAALQDLRQDHARLLTRVASAEQAAGELAGVRAECLALQDQVAAGAAELDAMRARAEALQARAAAVEAELASARGELQAAVGERSRAQAEVQALRAMAADTEARLAQAAGVEAELAAARGELQAAAGERSQAEAEAQALRASAAQLEARLAELEAAQGRIDVLARESRGLTERAERAEQRLQQHERATADERAQAKQSLDALTRERDALVRQVETLQADRDARQKRSAEQLAQLERELTEARQTVSLSTRLQMLRESDLRDLQGRFQAEQAKVQSQHELLSKLAQRLSVATQYFQQLSLEQQGGELVDGDEAARR